MIFSIDSQQRQTTLGDSLTMYKWMYPAQYQEMKSKVPCEIMTQICFGFGSLIAFLFISIG